MTRSVFYGFGAFVGSITGPTSCGWWPDDPASLGWAAGALLPIDLSKNPQAVRDGKITAAEVKVDDYAGYGTGGLTKIGPMWPGGVMNGACYVEQSYYDALAVKPPRVPPGTPCRDYELTTARYCNPSGQSRRFFGVHAQIRDARGDVALVAVWQPGLSLASDPIGLFWLQLAGAADPVANGLSQVGIGAANEGALFVDAATKKHIGFDPPKTPKWLGGASERPRRVVR